MSYEERELMLSMALFIEAHAERSSEPLIQAISKQVRSAMEPLLIQQELEKQRWAGPAVR